MESKSPMVKVTIISINSKNPADPKNSSNKVYTIEVRSGKTKGGTLEHAFEATNIDDRPYGTSVCSTSRGDILILDDQHWLCDSGWTPITQEQSFQIQQLSSRDTSMGIEFLIEKGLVKP